MRKILVLVFVFIFILPLGGFKEGLYAQLRVAKFKDNKFAAISYTFDDALTEQYTVLWPKLKEHGIKASFCINGKTINLYEKVLKYGASSREDSLVVIKPRITWTQLKEMSDEGQEITNHGWAHTNVTRIEGEALRYEVEHNDTVIWQHTGKFPHTFFYPGNAKKPNKVEYCERNRVGSRTFQVSWGSKRNEEWMREYVEDLINKQEWGVTMTHGISYGYDALKNPQILWNHFDWIDTKRDRVWVATFHDVCAYVKERNDVRLELRVESLEKMEVTPKMSLNPELFNEPLTMVSEREIKSVKQDGRKLQVKCVGGKYLFDFNPNGGKIVVRFASKVQPMPVYLVAGQSNTDGRVFNDELPQYIKDNGYKHCYWSYGSGANSGKGEFEKFYPRIFNKNNPHRWAYDAVVNYWLDQDYDRDFYVIKESLGGTAIDTTVQSSQGMYWSADETYLKNTAASDKGGKSLLKAFTENISACIDNFLSTKPEGYEFKAFLWHQGESDKKVGEKYYDNLKGVINYVRRYLVQKTGNTGYATLPVIVGSIPKAGRGYSSKVEAAQKKLQEDDHNFYLIDVNDATLRDDNIHFDAAGAEELGRKMYEKVKNLY